jgi:hypothetical protein
MRSPSRAAQWTSPIPRRGLAASTGVPAAQAHAPRWPRCTPRVNSSSIGPSDMKGFLASSTHLRVRAAGAQPALRHAGGDRRTGAGHPGRLLRRPIPPPCRADNPARPAVRLRLPQRVRVRTGPDPRRPREDQRRGCRTTGVAPTVINRGVALSVPAGRIPAHRRRATWTPDDAAAPAETFVRGVNMVEIWISKVASTAALPLRLRPHGLARVSDTGSSPGEQRHSVGLARNLQRRRGRGSPRPLQLLRRSLRLGHAA